MPVLYVGSSVIKKQETLDKRGKAMTARPCKATRLMAMVRRMNIVIRQNFDINMPILAQAACQCETCPCTDACDTWFMDGTKGDGYPAFCPNLELLDLLLHSAVKDFAA